MRQGATISTARTRPLNWVLTVPLCAVLVELLMRLPLAGPLGRLVRTGNRALHVVTAKAVSDHWKEKAMGAYAQTTFMTTLRLAGLLALWLGCALILVFGIDQFTDGFEEFLLSWRGIGFSIVVASLYAVARRMLLRG